MPRGTSAEAGATTDPTPRPAGQSPSEAPPASAQSAGDSAAGAAVAASDYLPGFEPVTLASVAAAHLRSFDRWSATRHEPEDVTPDLKAKLYRECITHAGLLAIDVRGLLAEHDTLAARVAAAEGERDAWKAASHMAADLYQQNLAAITGDRDRARAEADALRARLGALASLQPGDVREAEAALLGYVVTEHEAGETVPRLIRSPDRAACERVRAALAGAAPATEASAPMWAVYHTTGGGLLRRLLAVEHSEHTATAKRDEYGTEDEGYTVTPVVVTPADAARAGGGRVMEPVLCYVDEPWAYFTTQPLEKQWGDDWDDAPYEHNAGTPYGPLVYYLADGTTRPDPRDHTDGVPNFEIIRVAFTGDFDTPADRADGNSGYCVRDINAGDVPWLRPSRWGAKHQVRIAAGTTLADFIELVHSAGGTVYLPTTPTTPRPGAAAPSPETREDV